MKSLLDKNLEFKGKKVIVRVDLNVPMKDGSVTETSRIESAIGYGESRPINICDEAGETCTELEYSENRRSEFIVVSR